jgi:Neuraminidase (sialidase)
MSKFQRAKRTSLFVSLSLIITFALLIHVNFARAEDVEGISPNLGFDVVTLLGGQNASFSTSQTTPFDMYSVGVLSFFNKSLKAEFTSITAGESGLWWMTIMGTGGRNWFDYSFGLVFPKGYPAAEIDIGTEASIAIATGGIILFSDVSAEDPINYTIKVTGTAK